MGGRIGVAPVTHFPLQRNHDYLRTDLHNDESHVAALDDDAEVVEEIRVCDANLDEVAEEYAGAKAALEATSNYYTVYDTLDEYLEVVVADPSQAKAMGYAEVKNDRLDAKLLAQLRRAGMIAESYLPPEELRKRRAGVLYPELNGAIRHRRDS